MPNETASIDVYYPGGPGVATTWGSTPSSGSDQLDPLQAYPCPLLFALDGPLRDIRLAALCRVSVDWPDFRNDLMDGLDVLAGQPMEGPGVEGTRLESAVHAVVEDTGWDLPGADPDQSIGTMLVDQAEAEAEAVRPVVAAVCRVSDRQAPAAPVAGWFGDEEWPLVRLLAAAEASALRAKGD